MINLSFGGRSMNDDIRCMLCATTSNSNSNRNDFSLLPFSKQFGSMRHCIVFVTHDHMNSYGYNNDGFSLFTSSLHDAIDGSATATTNEHK